MDKDRLQTFDPNQPYAIVQRQLPHWSQAGTFCFITWRTADSMPRDVVQRWIEERNDLLKRAGIVVNDAGFGETGLHWKDAIQALSANARQNLQLALTERWDTHLDASHGACVLKERALATIVGDSLLKFDGDRYELTDFVVMPNHVHLLAAFRDEKGMLKQCADWKRYTARQINNRIGRTGELWQEDAFDHLVRSPEQFDHFRRYIAENGPRARLADEEYLWFSKV